MQVKKGMFFILFTNTVIFFKGHETGNIENQWPKVYHYFEPFNAIFNIDFRSPVQVADSLENATSRKNLDNLKVTARIIYKYCHRTVWQ